MRRLVLAAIAVALLAGFVVAGSGYARASGPVVGYPNSIAGLGDSITQAMDADGSFGDQPENSWVTGSSASVDSLYSRLLAVNPAISGNRFNDSVSGAQMVNLNGQAQNAVAQGAALVTILIGANDVCTSTEASMTPVATVHSQLEQAMQTLSSGLPDARIAVVSIPDIYNLWSILHSNFSATFVWNFAQICQSMLVNPTSPAPADVTRRANVRQRNIDDNTVLHDVCAEYVHCLFDDYLAFNTVFAPSDVSTLDYFHPSVSGQAHLASVAWDNSYDFTDVIPPVSQSTGTGAGGMGGGASVNLTATDNDAVSGIEFRIDAGAYQRYTGPVSVSAGSVITWRAVDINGNSEATQLCKVGGWSWQPGDSDCDGWPDSVAASGKAPETIIGTDPTQHCNIDSTPNNEPDAWPPDFNDDQKVGPLDVLKFSVPVYGSQAINGPPYSVRFDWDGNGAIGPTDVLKVVPFYGKTCA